MDHLPFSQWWCGSQACVALSHGARGLGLKKKSKKKSRLNKELIFDINAFWQLFWQLLTHYPYEIWSGVIGPGTLVSVKWPIKSAINTSRVKTICFVNYCLINRNKTAINGKMKKWLNILFTPRWTCYFCVPLSRSSGQHTDFVLSVCLSSNF